MHFIIDPKLDKTRSYLKYAKNIRLEQDAKFMKISLKSYQDFHSKTVILILDNILCLTWFGDNNFYSFLQGLICEMSVREDEVFSEYNAENAFAVLWCLFVRRCEDYMGFRRTSCHRQIWCILLLAIQQCVAYDFRNIIAVNTLPDGEVETRISYKKISAKETTVGKG